MTSQNRERKITDVKCYDEDDNFSLQSGTDAESSKNPQFADKQNTQMAKEGC